jgi:hypothetical protein
MQKMRKISLLAGLLAVTLGGAAVSTTAPAFAACLNPDAGLIDLTHNAMQPGAGWGYDKDAVDRELAKGNRCDLVKQQSQPVTGDQLNDFKPLNNQTRNGQNEYN